MQLTEEKMKQIQKLKGDLETDKSVHEQLRLQMATAKLTIA